MKIIAQIKPSSKVQCVSKLLDSFRLLSFLYCALRLDSLTRGVYLAADSATSATLSRSFLRQLRWF